MTRALALLAAVLATSVGAAGAAGAPPVFTVVPSTSAPTTLPSAETPNTPGSLVLPPSYLSRRESAGVPFTSLNGLWRRAGAAYGIPWEVLAAINKIESNFGRNMGPSSAGAIGWMQFMPDTWMRWGTDGNGDGVADPWNAEDAVFSASRYLAAAGGRTDLQRGIFAYNHAQWYVDDVLQLARLYGHGGPGVAFSFDRMGVQLDSARKAVARANRGLVAATKDERRLAGTARRLHARAEGARLLSDRLALLKSAVHSDAERDAAAAEVSRLRKKLQAAEQKLEEARTSSLTSSFAPGAAGLRPSQSATTTTTTQPPTSPRRRARPSTRWPTGSSEQRGRSRMATAGSASCSRPRTAAHGRTATSRTSSPGCSRAQSSPPGRRWALSARRATRPGRTCTCS
jgi:hypothetical protein